MAKGFTPPSPFNAAPRVCPYHRRLLPLPPNLRVARSLTAQFPGLKPFAQLTGPCHILSMAEASVGVRHVVSAAVHDAVVMLGSLDTLYSHARGSVRTPSATPSSRSQAATAAFVARACLALRVAAGPPP